jgi:hypothetical protein
MGARLARLHRATSSHDHEARRLECNPSPNPHAESETLMKIKPLMSALALGLALSTVGSLAQAASPAEDNSFDGMMKMPMIDKNKDNMVSKAEYLEMMGKLWDMKAKEMKVRGDMMTPADFAALTQFLSRGEKNK